MRPRITTQGAVKTHAYQSFRRQPLACVVALLYCSADKRLAVDTSIQTDVTSLTLLVLLAWRELIPAPRLDEPSRRPVFPDLICIWQMRQM